MTLAEGMAGLRAAVEERGWDYAYPEEWRAPGSEGDGGCRYVVDGKPACLIAAALARLGVPVEVLRDQGDRGDRDDDCEDGGEGPRSARQLLEAIGVDMPPLLLEAWQAAQNAQDAGRTWGQAYAETLAALPAGALPGGSR